MKDLLKFLAIVLLLGLLRAPAFGLTANDMTTPGVTPAILAAGLMPPGTTTLNAAFTGADSAAGTFSGGLGDGIPIDTGVILTTGDLVNASTTPNVIDNIGF